MSKEDILRKFLNDDVLAKEYISRGRDITPLFSLMMERIMELEKHMPCDHEWVNVTDGEHKGSLFCQRCGIALNGSFRIMKS